MSYKCGSCGAPADQWCPTCKELSADPASSHFCSTACFAKAWPEHKLGHKRAKEALATLLLSSAASPFRGTKFDSYAFRGPLRPFPMSPQVPPPPGIPPPDYARDGRPRGEEAERGKNTIAVYASPEELAALREAGAIAREVTDIAAAALRVGATGDEIDRIVHAATVARGAYPSPLNYCGFPKSVCVSVNEVICHGIPDLRPLADGDIVNLDITVYFKGVHADMNETYCIGNVDDTGRRLVRCAYDCLAAAVAACKPGVFYRDLGAVISKVAAAEGFTVVKNYTGHGTGRLFHTAPNVPHYANNKAQGIMRVGHVFTVEPVREKRGGPRPPHQRARLQTTDARPPLPIHPPADDQRGQGGG
jgi:methionyl aminopeptidase